MKMVPSRQRRLYRGTNSMERFQLSILAVARQDQAAVRQIVSAGPYVTVTKVDPVFLALQDASREVVTVFAMGVAYTLGLLRGLEGGGTWCSNVARIWEEAARRERGERPGHREEFASPVVSSLRGGVIARIAADLAALDSVATEVAGLDGEVLLRAWAPELLAALTPLSEELAAAEPAPEDIQAAEEFFRRAWDGLAP
jgi:hypothetical protein